MGNPDNTIQSSSREFRFRWWGLAGVSLAVFMAALDSNVVNVALPIMARAFNVSKDVRWVVLAYILPTTALLGAFGALSDIVGRRRITLAGVVLFVAGSALCGTAQSLGQMVIYRVIQALGGACLGSAILAIATVNFAPHERGRAMAVIALIVPLGGVVGPSVGGLLIGAFGWPAIFYINVPFGIISFILIARLLPKDRAQGIRSFDAWGAALFTISLVLLIMGLSPSANGLTTRDFVLLAACAVTLTAFVAVERRAKDPLLPLSLARRRNFSIPLAGLMTSTLSASGLGFVLPFFLENALHLSPERAGLTLLFFPLGIALASQIGGRLSDRLRPQIPAAAGAAMALLGIVLCLPLSNAWTTVDVAVRLAIIGLGAGFYIPPSNVAIMAATPRDHVGVGGGLVNTGRFLGFALGPTVATILWSPSLQGAASLSAMRVVLTVMVVSQVATLASVLAFSSKTEDREARSKLESSSGAAA
ncbi:MAG TPA: DHA2 family efflux MFS transporter permease subunit [Spirochaetia bacterium]|nr:DHA2 family efflux MFS transporter permease subunit [Spirochaetia bacterium]